MEEFKFYRETCFYHATISFATSTGTSKTKPAHKKQNKKTASGLLPKKNDNEEESVTGNEDDGSEMGKMMKAFTPREIQIFSKESRKRREIRPKSRRESRLLYRIREEQERTAQGKSCKAQGK